MHKKLAIVLFSLSSIVRADSASLVDGGMNAFLATMDTFSIEVHDQVQDRCLPHPAALGDKLEIALRKNGFRITEDSFLSNVIHISPVGYETNTTNCAVNISVTLAFATIANVPYATNLEVSSTLLSSQHRLASTLLTGSKTSIQSRLEAEVVEAADKLFLDISRARDDIFDKFPSIKASFEASKLRRINR